jgi:hypothetical protein
MAPSRAHDPTKPQRLLGAGSRRRSKSGCLEFGALTPVKRRRRPPQAAVQRQPVAYVFSDSCLSCARSSLSRGVWQCGRLRRLAGAVPGRLTKAGC